jgi:hypothetical protein
MCRGRHVARGGGCVQARPDSDALILAAARQSWLEDATREVEDRVAIRIRDHEHRFARAGELKLVPEPAGSHGYDDLRRHASREPLGRGVRPQVASPGDLARMLGALEREHEIPVLLRLRRVIELDRELTRGRVLER